MEIPDKWIVIKITGGDKPLYKVFASWYGGYLGSDSWKINSGIKIIEECEYHFNFIGYSGSCYQCVKGRYGTNNYAQNILNSIIKSIPTEYSLEILPEDTDWSKLLNN